MHCRLLGHAAAFSDEALIGPRCRVLGIQGAPIQQFAHILAKGVETGSYLVPWPHLEKCFTGEPHMRLDAGESQLRRLETFTVVEEDVGAVTDAAESSYRPSQNGLDFELRRLRCTEQFRTKGQADAVRVGFTETTWIVELQSFDSQLGQALQAFSIVTRGRPVLYVFYTYIYIYPIGKTFCTDPRNSSHRSHSYPDYA